MALVFADRVQQTGTANTTVSFTLSGSVTGFQSFTAGVGNGNTTYYAAYDTSGNWETGLGTYSTTGPTLTRTTISASSNSNLAVTFSGTVNVFVTYIAAKSVILDASGNATGLGTPASFVGTNITGTASSLTSGNATNTAITDDTATATTCYPTWVTATTGNLPQKTTSTRLSFVPSTGALTATSHVSSSDERLKENWRDLPDTFLDDLAEVKHGSYNRIGNEWREAGVSAQSLMEVLPETVIADEKGMLSVSYGNAALIAAIELAKEVKALRAEIAKLKAK